MMELVHFHNYVPLYEQQKEKKWLQKTGMSTVDRVGKRVGILGYGSIGRQGELSFFLNPFLYRKRLGAVDCTLCAPLYRTIMCGTAIEIEHLDKVSCSETMTREAPLWTTTEVTVITNAMPQEL